VSLKVLNTLGRKKEAFKPKQAEQVKMYVCGPTVYNYIHIGNARCYIVFDVIKRYLKFKGFDVYHVQNFTDVDDKIINRASEEGITCEEVTSKYEKAFLNDMEALGVDLPNVTPRATENIKGMIEMVKGLIEKGHAYEVNGDVYFRVDSFPSYGKLSGRSKDEMLAGARVEIDKRKENPLDFALWKAAKPGEPAWESPWGMGRPGWHIECSVMSLNHLGMSFDIHGGGEDLIFPHHENEIAQSEAFTGQEPFVRYWLHNGLLTIRQEKMAKSVGNIIFLKDLLKKYHPNALRLFYLSTHYRSPLDYTEERMEEATRAWERLETAVENADFYLAKGNFGSSPAGEKRLFEAIEKAKKDFNGAMDDDFNTPQALAALFELVREVNLFLDENKGNFSVEGGKILNQARQALIDLAQVFGVRLGEYRRDFLKKITPELMKLAKTQGIQAASSAEKVLEKLLALREAARREKDWEKSDGLRDKIQELGIELEDTPLGPHWRASYL
jgi:cysteinyl-tRNA synthetase